eukprot:1009557-Pyramimonas_sp.AAC.1
MGPVFERYGETRQAFLEATRIDGVECLLIDPGACDNLAGSIWVERQGALAREARLAPMQTEMGVHVNMRGMCWRRRSDRRGGDQGAWRCRSRP